MTIQTTPVHNDGADRHGRALVVAARAVLATGGACRITAEPHPVCVLAIDGLAPDRFEAAVRRAAGQARLVLTGPRAQALGLNVPMTSTVALTLPAEVDPALLRLLAEMPSDTVGEVLGRGVTLAHAHEAERAGIELAKRAGLLPAVLALPEAAVERVEVELPAGEVTTQRRREIETLRPVVETRLPIAAVEDARLVVFRSAAGGSDQVALLIGQPETATAPLCRLHSECLTGDLFGSLRCDCGEQLHGALARMAEEGAGVLLYLRQEGRGIGLVNKLRAYRLQDQGLDTVDANTHLGFQPDERDFATAATMLQRLSFKRIRLLTNNPDKLEALGRHGVVIDQRVPLTVAANRHNRFYLETKARKSGHLLRVIEGGKAGESGKVNGWSEPEALARLLAAGAGRELGV